MSWRTEFDPKQERRRQVTRMGAKLRQLQREAIKYDVDITPELRSCIQAAEAKIVAELKRNE